jgi:hypothetical protein
MPQEVFPCPVFEGSEKRIAVTFAPGPATPPAGLRTLSRVELDSMLDLAACQIVSSRGNEHFDAYVLSESSLFVYPGEEATFSFLCVSLFSPFFPAEFDFGAI